MDKIPKKFIIMLMLTAVVVFSGVRLASANFFTKSSYAANKLAAKSEETVQREKGYLLLQKGEKLAALKHFLAAEKINPQNEHTRLQIAYIYAQLGNRKKAKEIFQQLAKSQDNKIKSEAMKNLAFYQPKKSVTPKKMMKSPGGSVTRLDQMLNEYYSLNRKNRYKAQQKLLQIIRLYPRNVTALLERGYFLLGQKNYQAALPVFQKICRLQPDNYIVKKQLGYIYNALKRPIEAYHMFKLASYSSDPEIAQSSRDAMINIASEHSKLFPSPWFAEFYFAPSHQGRYDYSIVPFFLRFGVELGQENRLKIYVRLRSTQDSLSTGGLRPDIYEDNVAIISGGISYRPILKLPIDFYAEGGRAYDWVDRDRSRWRSDFRMGLWGYERWGARPVYAPKPRFVLKPVADGYADISYFSRYDDNIIGQLLFRPGFRIFEMYNSSIKVYAIGEYFFDTRKVYYNNLTECGGGIAFIPHNHINWTIRVERVKGNYIDVDSPEPNPGPNRYYNTIIMSDFYIKL